MNTSLKNLSQVLPQSIEDEKFLTWCKDILQVDDFKSVWSGVTLCLIVDGYLLFIKRSLSMPTHPGQIAWIGGHILPEETDPIEAIKREFSEETAMDPCTLDFHGLLPPVFTSPGQLVCPVVATIDNYAPLDFMKAIRSNGEWDECFFVAIKELSRIESWHHGLRISSNSTGALLYRPLPSGSYINSSQNDETYLLWGATARMVWNFFRATL